jgi:hypothetical protein
MWAMLGNIVWGRGTQRQEEQRRKERREASSREEDTLRNDQRTTLRCRSDQECQQQQPDKRGKRAAVNSDENQLASGKKRRRVAKAAVEEEEEYPVKKEEIEDDFHQDKDETEDCKEPPVTVKIEEVDKTEAKEDGEDDLHQDKDESEASMKPPAVVKKEEEDEPENCKGSPALVKKEEKDPADEKPAAPGRSDVCIENRTISEQPGGRRMEDTSINTRRYPKRSGSSANIVKKKYSLRSISQPDDCRIAEQSRSSANIVKRKYSLRSLSQQNNKKSARSKPLRKEKGSSTNLGKVNQNPMTTSGEDEFGKGIESAVDEACDTSDFNLKGKKNKENWNSQFNQLREYYEKHGHCELFWVVHRFLLS